MLMNVSSMNIKCIIVVETKPIIKITNTLVIIEYVSNLDNNDLDILQQLVYNPHNDW